MAIALPSQKVRQYVYNVVVAAIPVLLLLNLVAPSDVALWLNVAAAVLGLASSGQAAVALRQQRSAQTRARKRRPAKAAPGAHPHPLPKGTATPPDAP